MVILLCVSQAVKALYTRDNNTPRKYGPLATHQLAGGVRGDNI